MAFPYQRLSGFFTQQKFIVGQTLPELERRLGYRSGRLAQGAYVYRAEQLPTANDFELYGYSQVSGDKLNTGGQYDRSKANKLWPGSKDIELNKLKSIAMSGWQLSGPDSLVKVMPVTPHSENETYPPGSGVPQWRVTNAVQCRLVVFIKGPNGKFNLF
ncbi:MAG: hypothetical protein IPN76_26345 [Saprospiraceae bacterium]|nr:hypothetical protein [Saprospiraceae bacterium]